jgi:hypothetical protein
MKDFRKEFKTPSAIFHQAFSTTTKLISNNKRQTMTNRSGNQALIRAYGNWIIQEVSYGRIPYYINIMFDPLDRYYSPAMKQMTDAIYAAKGSFYAKLCSRFDRHPGRKGRNRFLPHAFLFFDLPVFKYGKKSVLLDVQINGGVHLNGIMTIPAKSRIKDEFSRHIWKNRALYTQNGIRRIHVEPVTHDPYRVADYAMKTMKNGRIDWDTTIILPRTYSELKSAPVEVDPRTRAIKQIQSATNVSDDIAKDIYRRKP